MGSSCASRGPILPPWGLSQRGWRLGGPPWGLAGSASWCCFEGRRLFFSFFSFCSFPRCFFRFCNSNFAHSLVYALFSLFLSSPRQRHNEEHSFSLCALSQHTAFRKEKKKKRRKTLHLFRSGLERKEFVPSLSSFSFYRAACFGLLIYLTKSEVGKNARRVFRRRAARKKQAIGGFSKEKNSRRKT